MANFLFIFCFFYVEIRIYFQLNYLNACYYNRFDGPLYTKFIHFFSPSVIKLMKIPFIKSENNVANKMIIVNHVINHYHPLVFSLCHEN